jgi:hypothetical protein
MNITIILTLDVLITFLACNILGPASFKLGGLGLVGWAARVPFYLLRLYIGPAVLLLSDFETWCMTGPLLGAALTLPLALWSTVPGCPAAEKWLNLASAQRTAPHGIQRGFRRDFHNRETALQPCIPLKRAA